MSETSTGTLPETKTCTRCQKVLPASDFGTRKLRTGRTALRSVCRDCRSLIRSTKRRRPEDTHKTCAACGESKELHLFYKRGNTLRSSCFDCEGEKKSQASREKTAKRRAEREAAVQRVKDTGLKTCRECGTEMPVFKFHANKSSKDGYNSRCAVCVRVRRKKVGAEDEDRVHRWASREAQFKEIAESARRRRFKKPTQFAWEDEE
tara:strand:- start:336 stop:953 length:618 start_codon:yes stop_codon:yes gene_type:complete